MSEETVDNVEESKEEPKEEFGVALPAAPLPVKAYLIKYTLDGEILVEVVDGNNIEMPLKTVPLTPLPASFREEHLIELKLFHSLVLTVKKNLPKRQVPVTRKEFLKSGASSKLIHQLVTLGFLKEAIIPLLSSSGKNPGSRVCLFYTPQGRALIRERLDPEYAKTDYC